MRKIVVGLSLPLSGEYSATGLQIETALRLFASDTNAAGGVDLGGERHQLQFEYRDDASRRDRVRDIYRWLCFERGVDLIFGPYSTALTRVAAAVAGEARMLLINHGGAGDDLYPGDRPGQPRPLIAGILSPASDYMTGFVRLLATLKFWRKRLAIVAAKTPFARAVAAGAEHQSRVRRMWLHGVRLRLKYTTRFDPDHTPTALRSALRRNRINAVISAGGYEHDLAIMRLCAAHEANIPVLACVAAGVARFGADLADDAEGIVGPSQWEADADISPELGPSNRDFVRRMSALGIPDPDYPSAQAYAAGLVTLAALRMADSLDHALIRKALANLRTTTLFGDFAIDPSSGRQVGHKMLLVQWHRGRKVLIDAEPDPNQGAIEFPSGWRLVLASMQYFRLSRRPGDDEDPRGSHPPDDIDERNDDKKD
ncbi:MAG TPA: amino acid ABC transporter substrate-binding protein [Candidatus Binataceae bacterium]|jgi:branched-chain amino acid transport system substrate-binding protein|nr:amino acid ABC transporter substrate-binding protein [Candidatus Binataceae bacterium]